MPDIDCIRVQLSLHPGSKLGSVIYRMTYINDAQWTRFMSHLNTRVQRGLEETGDSDIFPYIDWDVQTDPALSESRYETDAAQYQAVRERYATYISQHPDVDSSIPRSTACVTVTQDLVDWVLEGPVPEKYSSSEEFVELVAVDHEDGEQSRHKISCLVPRVYALIDALGCEQIRTAEDNMFAERKSHRGRGVGIRPEVLGLRIVDLVADERWAWLMLAPLRMYMLAE